MDKMFTSILVADMTEEAKAHGVRAVDLPAEKATYKGHVMNVEALEATNAKGERETMWHLLSEPWFFAHDLATKNITAVPAKLLEDVAAKVRMDGDAVVIRDYLIRRIKWMERIDASQVPGHTRQPREERAIQEAAAGNPRKGTRNREWTRGLGRPAKRHRRQGVQHAFRRGASDQDGNRLHFQGPRGV